ncbi:MAG: hypothetical protein ABL973_09075 [Micropepsaceae bacterium]
MELPLRKQNLAFFFNEIEPFPLGKLQADSHLTWRRSIRADASFLSFVAPIIQPAASPILFSAAS